MMVGTKLSRPLKSEILNVFAEDKRSGLEDVGSPSKTAPSPRATPVKAKAKLELRSRKGSKARSEDAEYLALPSKQAHAGAAQPDSILSHSCNQQLTPRSAGLGSSDGDSSCGSDIELLPLHQRLQLRRPACRATPEPPAQDIGQVQLLLHLASFDVRPGCPSVRQCTFLLLC